MYSKLKSSLLALSLASSFALAAPMFAPNADMAFAKSKNYIKISKNAIGKSRRLNVGLNKSLVIDLPADAHDILVANPEIADAITRTSSRIYIFAKQVGETNIFIFDSAGNQLLSLDMKVERDVEGLEAYLKKYIPGSNIKVEIVNDNIILTGSVPTPQTAAKAMELAQIFVKGGAATTPAYSRVTDTDGNTTVTGGNTFERESQFVNLLEIDAEDQVNLKVTVAEIQRTIVKQLGIDLYSSGSLAGLTTGLITDNPFGLGRFNSHNGISAQGKLGTTDISGVLRALNQAGVMRTLAEPSLTAISGESAEFEVGGEYNVSAGKTDTGDLSDPRPNGSVVYETKTIEYGIKLKFTPVVLSPGRISLAIATSVSEPTTEGATAIPRFGSAAVTSPGIRTRKATTKVELPSGGSMVIAGLIKDDVRQAVTGFPGLSRIPVLGTLFRSRDYQRFESELVIIVTPYLVRPVARQALARPDDNFNPAADSSGMFLGRVNRIYGTKSGKLPKGKYHGNPGFIFK